jgi:cell division protein ZipA
VLDEIGSLYSACLRIIQAMDANELRIVLVLAGALVLAAIYWFGRPKRVEAGRREPKMPWAESGTALSEQFYVAQNDPDAEAPGLSSNYSEQVAHESDGAEEESGLLGERNQREFDLIISLHVMCRDDGMISGGELVVAAEKASLVYGAQGLFHRLVDGRPEVGPIFSMINRVQPGRFDLSKINELSTPGVSFFMTLPCALAGLDAWDRMLPAAQRLAGLLNAEVFDDEMNLLGRQRIASIREELRAYDRKREIRTR